MPRATKVGIVVPFSWSFRGGVLDHARHQAEALLTLGVDARLLVGYDPPDALTRLIHMRQTREDALPPYAIPLGRSVPMRANGSLACIVLAPSAIGRLRRTLDRENFDVLHVHDPFAPVLSMLALAVSSCPRGRHLSRQWEPSPLPTRPSRLQTDHPADRLPDRGL
jgi:phosphatidylinositol alpha-mannosyltransferase